MEGNKDLTDKALRLVDFLSALNQLRRKIYTNVDQYEDLLWFHEIPKDPQYCFTQAWGANEDFDQDTWVEVKKYDEPKIPKIPQKCDQWVDRSSLHNTEELPDLFSSIPLEVEVPNPDWDPEDPDDQDKYTTTIKTINLGDDPDISEAWDRYIEQKWLPWTDLHRKWDKVHNVYSQLFAIYQQQQKLGEEYELVLGVGLLTWKPTIGNPIRRHLITSKADLIFDAKSGKFTVTASIDDPKPSVELDMLELAEQPNQAKKIADEALASSDQNPWNHSTTDPILSALTNSLSERGDGEYYKTQIKPEKLRSKDKPVVEYAPALLLRKRSMRGFDQTLQTIRSQIAEGGEMPSGFIDITEGESNGGTSHSGEEPDFVRIENDAPVNLPQTIYFPKPYNKEQEKIIAKLEKKEGVLVQGPPGTGKSHTIANLICHYLATGNRILVTAQTPRALRVLHEKLPKQLRPLCISLLGTGPEEMESLKSSVGAILAEQDKWVKPNADRKIGDLDNHIKDLKSERGKINHRVRSIRERETLTHNLFNGAYNGTATKIAQAVKAESKRFEWFQDEIHYSKELPISKNELLKTRSELILVPEATRHEVGQAVPKPGHDLPTPECFENLTSQQKKHSSCVSEIGHTADPHLVALLSQASTVNVESLISSLSKLSAEVESVRNRPMKWIDKAVYDMLTDNDTPWKAMLSLSARNLENLKERAENISDQKISIPEQHEIKKVLSDAKVLKKHFDAGGTIGWGMFRKRLVKDRLYLIDEIKLNGLSCDSSDSLERLVEHLDVLDRISNAWGVWEGLVERRSTKLPLIQVAELEELQEALDRVVNLYDLHQEAKEAIYSIQGVAEPTWHDREAILKLLGVCDLVVAKRELSELKEELEKWENKIQKFSTLPNAHPICKEIIPIFQKSDPTFYSNLILEIGKIINHFDCMGRSNQTLKKLEEVAPLFVTQLYSNPNDIKWDDRLESIEQVWACARAKSWLVDFINVEDIESLERQLQNIDQSINDDVAELASLRSWGFCFERMDPGTRSSLVGWQDNVIRIGRGTGRHAPKYRKEAQRHLNECKKAIPAWVMPLHRVWDTVQPTPGVFDLIIVDEASQCGWQSLPLLYLAKKMIVVGDDQQISPQSVGINKDNVQALMNQFLSDFDQRDSFDTENSLFGHARRRFPAPIVLREHFRCMPEIISFSNNLCYQATPLIPLRQYPPQRLEPLISKYISNGEREGSGQKVFNRIEAEAVVDSIIECCKDERYNGKTMGVIVLQGKAQATLIDKLLLEKIDGKEITAEDLYKTRKFLCGDPYSFQGDERQVMFISMVAARNEMIPALTKPDFQKRFNVAASRAQDQMFLFHSVPDGELPDTCFRKKLLRHFMDPSSVIARALEDAEHLRELAHKANRQNESPPKPFDSWFEVDVALEIAARGYKVIPQYEVADKRIDLVIEGAQSRLAVEVDGDHWHGPEQYDADMERQRQLERCQWTFHRIRESEFYFFKEETLNKLWHALESHGIHPIGSTGYKQKTDGEQENIIEDSQVTKSPPKTDGEQENTIEGSQVTESPPKTEEPEPNSTATKNLSLTPYTTFEGSDLEDPSSANCSNNKVAEGLSRIVEAEGPMLAKRAYDVYIRACGIRRLGRQLKTIMNRAMQHAIRTGKIEREDEWDEGGVIHSIVRAQGSPKIKLREKGPRDLDEIPASELLIVARLVKKTSSEMGDEAHIRDILEFYGLRRLTSNVQKLFDDLFELRISYVDDYVIQKSDSNPDRARNKYFPL